MSRVQLKRKKPVIGLAGGIGAGKTAVAKILESLGAAVIDSDKLNHEQLGKPEVVATLRRWWGKAVCPDGATVDRAALARIVFNDPAELDRLQNLVYPRIEQRRLGLTAEYERDPRIRAIVIDSPKLFEAGLNEQCDAVIFVAADPAVRVARTQAERHWSGDELARREKWLGPLDKKRANADYVVVNHSSLSELRCKIEQVFASVLAGFSESRK